MGGPGSGRPPGELVITARLIEQLREHPDATPERATKAEVIAADLIATARNAKDPCRFKAIEEILLRVEGPILSGWEPIDTRPGFDITMLAGVSDEGLDALTKIVETLEPSRRALTEKTYLRVEGPLAEKT